PNALLDVKSRAQGVVVTGCLPQRFREELPKLLPEVDAFMGIDQVGQISEIALQALARRAEKLAANQSKAGIKDGILVSTPPALRNKEPIVNKLSELERTA